MNRRREIADRVLAKWKARGYALEAVPDWIYLVELWIDGAIDGAEMRRRYLATLKAQAYAQRLKETPARAAMITMGTAPEAESATVTADPSELLD